MGIKLNDKLSQEECFASWLEGNLSMIQSNFQDSDFAQSLSNLNALAELLKEHHHSSAILRILHKFTSSLIAITNKTIRLEQEKRTAMNFSDDIERLINRQIQSSLKKNNHFTIIFLMNYLKHLEVK